MQICKISSHVFEPAVARVKLGYFFFSRLLLQKTEQEKRNRSNYSVFGYAKSHPSVMSSNITKFIDNEKRQVHFDDGDVVEDIEEKELIAVKQKN